LEATGLAENTLVAFTSDNGGSLAHAQNNDPWRDGKQSHYDGGIRVPFTIRWPGVVPAGSVSDYNGQVFDLFPTAVEVAGAKLPMDLDAVSLLPVLRGEEMPTGRELYFVRREGGRRYGGKSYEAIIRGPWKLMRNSPYEPLKLYNLQQDPGESTDLATNERQIFNQLSDALRRHTQRAGGTPWQPPIYFGVSE